MTNFARRAVPMVVAGVLVAASCAPTPEARESETIASESAARIAQPTVGGIEVASEDSRVDLAMPRFSDPTNITNPLFPVAEQGSVLLLGEVDGKAFRTEVTLLPETRVIEWDGQQIEASVSQYVAFLDDRIEEVAYDFYAQADEGSVWYLGEDVYNFADGAIVDTHGTWIAGKDGPGAMIMPADPSVGDTYRPENIPGFVFEEVTVVDIDKTVDGPFGPIQGALLVRELHMDGTTEDKIFAPGYGEFYTAGGGDVEALAMSAQADAADTPEPPELRALEAAAEGVATSSAKGDWASASKYLDELSAAWGAYPTDEVPRLVAERMNKQLMSLDVEVRNEDELGARQVAIALTQSVFDLQLLYRPIVDVDMARFRLWGSQLELDAQGGDASAVTGDAFTLDYIRDRVLQGLDAGDASTLNVSLEDLQTAIGDADQRGIFAAARAIEGMQLSAGVVSPA